MPEVGEVGIDTSPKFDRRPWGTFTVLDEGENFKVKRIEVLPGKRLSYQKHAQRAEHWFVVLGTAKVTLDDREITVSAGESIDIRESVWTGRVIWLRHSVAKLGHFVREQPVRNAHLIQVGVA